MIAAASLPNLKVFNGGTRLRKSLGAAAFFLKIKNLIVEFKIKTFLFPYS